MSSALFTPLSQEEFEALAFDAYNAEATTPANTGTGSTMGAIGNAASTLALQLQQQGLYLEAIARLLTIPALPSGQPSPDAVSFCAPWGIAPLGSAAATSQAFLFTTPSAVSGGPLVIPVGGVAQTPGGLLWVVIADPTNSNYSAGLKGYPIANGLTSTSVTMACLTAGSIGNLPAGSLLFPYNSSNTAPITGIQSITVSATISTGQDGETDAAFKARFTLTVSSGRAGTANAIIAAVLAIQPGLIYSFGDRVNADGSSHNAYFTFVVNEAGTGSGAPGGLITAAAAAVNSANGRSAGISFQVIGPATIVVNVTVTITVAPGVDQTAATAAVQAAITNYINNIGLAPDTSATVCDIGLGYVAAYGAQVNGAQAVAKVQNLQYNGEGVDQSAAFAYQFVAGSVNVTVAS
jgi:uncharacterized phage protein gp47/JayE